MKKIIITIFSLIILIPIFASAENGLSISVSGDLKPNSSVTLKLNSQYNDIGGTKIMWYHGEELEEEGVGLTTHKVYLGNVGESVKVTAILAIENSEGAFNVSTTLTPAFLDVLWEADTAVPPFYRGKALPSNESLVKTIAIPYFGTTTKSTSVNYSWKKNKNVNIGEGINKQSTTILGGWENEKTDVSVSASYNGMTANSSMKVPSFKPSAVFYEISPTQGILNQEILNNNPVRNSIELTLKAVPFGFSNKERGRSQMIYEWKAGDKIIKQGTGESMETISLSRSASKLTEGAIDIQLSIQNTINVMQYSISKFNWIFTKK